MDERVSALEASRAAKDAGTLSAVDEQRPAAGSDFVRQDEFRLFKWLGTFVVATVLAGFGFLYEQSADLRVTMERLHAELLGEMHTQHASIREEMRAEHTSLREDMHAEHMGIREDVHAEHTSLRGDMHAQHAAIRTKIGEVRERVVRLETLGGVESD